MWGKGVAHDHVNAYVAGLTFARPLQPHQETMMTEVNQITTDIDHALSSLPTWMAPEHVQKDLLNRFNSAYLLQEPYGVVLIISPWNYPLMLTLMPLTGAIAAGTYMYVGSS